MTTILLRRGTASDWDTADPTLGEGEPAYETDTGRLKIGDGTTPFSALPYQNDVLAQVFSTDLTTPVHFFSGDVEPSVAGLSVDDQYVWVDSANAAVKKWNQSANDWDVVIQGSGPLAAGDIGYDNTPYTNVAEALDGLDGQHVNLDVAGHRDRRWKSATDPVGLGEAPTVGDEWIDPTDGVTYDWVDEVGASGIGEPWEHLSADWLETGTVAEPRVDSLIARVAQVNDLITAALGGLDPDVLVQLQALAADLVVQVTITANGTTTITSSGEFTAEMDGKTITGNTIPANTTLTFVNANSATVSNTIPAGTINAVVHMIPDVTALQDQIAAKVDADVAASGELYWVNPFTGLPDGVALNTIAAATQFADTFAPLNVAVNTRVSAYTLALADAKKLLAYNNTGFGETFTIPPNSSVAFPVGTGIPWFQRGQAPIVFTAGSGVTIISKDSHVVSNGQGSSGYLYKAATNEWWLMGDLT